MIHALIPHSAPPEGPGSLLSREDRELLLHVIDRLNVARGRIDDYENCGIIVESAANKLTDILVRAADQAELVTQPAAKATAKNRWQAEAVWRGGGKKQGNRIRVEATAAEEIEARRLLADKASKKGHGYVLEYDSVRVVR